MRRLLLIASALVVGCTAGKSFSLLGGQCGKNVSWEYCECQGYYEFYSEWHNPITHLGSARPHWECDELR